MLLRLSKIRTIIPQVASRIIPVFLAIALFWPVRLVGQYKPKLLELVYFYGLNNHHFSSEYHHQYSPAFESGSALSSASHYQQFESTKNKDHTVSLRIFPEKYFGIGISYSYESSSLSGISSDYEVSLRNISRSPPSYDPVEVFFNRSNPWPNPHGYLNLKILSLNPAVRFSILRRWQLYLSAGLASFFLKGELGPIACTRFWLGGHSVLFSEEYKLLLA